MHERTKFAELVRTISTHSGLSQREVTHVLHDLRDIIRQGLDRDGHVRLDGLGGFDLRSVKGHSTRHPKNGTVLAVAEHTRVVFHPQRALTARLNAVTVAFAAQAPRQSWWGVAALGTCMVALLTLLRGSAPAPVAQVVVPPAAAVQAAPPPPLLVKPPPAIVHVVKPGDTLSDLATRYYKSSDRWPAIAAANPRIVNPNRIAIGDALIIPPSFPTATAANRTAGTGRAR